MGMEQKTAKPRALKPSFLLGLMSALLLFGAGISFALVLGRVQRPAAVERSFVSYIEGLAVSGKLVLVQARERLTIRDTTPGFLFGDGAVGRFLGIRSDATIEVSAWADLSFAVDLNGTEGWAVRYLPADGGRLELAVPPLGMLTPAVLTETVEAKVSDRSIFLDESRLLESARRSLTARFVEAASAMVDDPAVREKAADALVALARTFAEKTGVRAAAIGVSFAPAED